ncbi:hypothetical protein TI39_contig625g00008 [Zymoseptoria brevis]|uniref:Uncharacterized protein n=1 Tax=Zymoseptoria brevis TaxID=1047168 RepID=A0A0F4GGF1_9PEZI|nr:hypothetical protein TI39_contig625g00008 [Zymoseptoria brevis]
MKYSVALAVLAAFSASAIAVRFCLAKHSRRLAQAPLKASAVDAIKVKREAGIDEVIEERCGVGYPCSQFGKAYEAGEAPVADAVGVKREPEINDIEKRCGVGSPCSQIGKSYAAYEAEAEPETKEE